jgi:uncharacterized protein YuzE
MTTLKDLTPNFRNVRLLLAREKGHPTGEREVGYDILVPLDQNGQLIAAEWKSHQESCRVRRFSGGEDDRIGRLKRKPGGQWYFDYAEGERDDEIGFRFGEERFVVGEYVSITSSGDQHTYQVARVEKP